MTLLAAQASLGASNEAALRQAASASKAAEDLLAQKDKTATGNSKELEETLSKLKGELAEARKGNCLKCCLKIDFLFPNLPLIERSQALKDLEAIKTQSEGLAREYDRLSEEHSKLSKKLTILEEGSTDKKDD